METCGGDDMKKRKYAQERINPEMVFKRNWKIILIVGLICFLPLTIVSLKKEKKYYGASVLIKVEPVTTSISGNNYDSILSYYQEYIGNQKYKILKKKNIEQALKRLSKDELKSFTGRDKIDDIAVIIATNSITIERVNMTQIVNIGVTALKPKGLDKFINTVVDIYIEENKRERVDSTENKIVYLEKEKKRLQEEILSKNNEIKNITKELETGNLSQEDAPYKAEMKVQEQAAIEAENDRRKKEKLYLELKKNLEELKDIPMETAIQEKINSDEVLMEQKKSIYEEIEKVKYDLLRITDKNKDKKELETKLTELNRKLKDADDEARKKYTKIIKRENEYEINKKLLDVKMDYEVAKQYEDEIKKSYNDLKKKYSETSKKVMDGGNISEEVSKLRNNLDRVDEQLIYLRGEKNSSGRISIENYANGVMLQQNTKTFKKIIVLVVISFGWIIVAVIIFEMIDKRVKSVEELKNAIGIKPTWPISKLKDGSFIDISFDMEGKVQRKALGSLAVKLNDERVEKNANVIAFTGVSEKSGVTEIAINIAHIMKGNWAEVLLIELNKESSSLKEKLEIIGFENGMSNFISGKDIKESVFEDKKREIHVLHYDGKSELNSQEINEIIERAKKEYHIVIIDTAPILKSYVTEQVILKADVVAMVVNGNATKYGEINKTMEIMERISVKSLTLVLNWLGEIKKKI